MQQFFVRGPVSSGFTVLLCAWSMFGLLVSARERLTAATIDVINAGFEDISGQSPFNEFTFGPNNGWELYDPNAITQGGAGPTYYLGTLTPFEADPVGNPGIFTNFPAGAPEGQRVAIAFNFEGSGDQGEYGIAQELADTPLQADTTYQLQVEIGNIASGTAMSGEFFPLDGFPGYRVDLLAGGVVIAQDNNTLAGSIADGEFSTTTIEYTPSAAHPQIDQDLAIRLVNLNRIDPTFPNSDLEVDFDHVRLLATPGKACDFDGDSICDVSDIHQMYSAGDLALGVAVEVGHPLDLDADMVLGAQDLEIWLDIAAADNGYGSAFRRGDTDEIGPGTIRDVDITDFNTLADNFAPVGNGDPTDGPMWNEGNFDGDDDIDLTDFNLLGANFSPSGYGAYHTLPEPSGMLLVFMAVLGLFYRATG